MDKFTLDTSGEINCGNDPYDAVAWSDLSPFAQGYVEAALREFGHCWADDNGDLHVSYSALHPEALAMILRDCERAPKSWSAARAGELFWRDRQHGCNNANRDGFPPLRVYLDDDGKVRLEDRQ